MIRLMASDIDGTLLDENRSLSPRTVTTLRSLQIPIVLISARMPQAMTPLQERLGILGSPLVCYNGALVLDGDKVLFDKQIDINTVESVVSCAQQFDLHLSIYSGCSWWVPQMDYWAKREQNNTVVMPIAQTYTQTLTHLQTHQIGAHKLMLMGDSDKMQKAFEALDSLESHVHRYRSKDTYTEITPKPIGKQSALRVLLKSHFPKIDMEHVLAFGDNYNDVEMLAKVGYGVAVANAREETKAAARFLTEHHKKDGVAKWIETNSELFL